MTARTDFLSYLTGLGTTPNRALTFEEGSGTPVEHYTATTMGISGSWTWLTDPTYGRAFRSNATTDFLTFVGASNGFLSTTAQTLLIIRRKTDVTLRNAQSCGINAGAVNELAIYNPFGDGIVYADFGGQTSPNRLTYSSYTPTTNLEAWALRSGTLGSSLWKDGVNVLEQFTAITRTASAAGYFVNRGFLNNGDLQEFYFFCLVPFELTDTELQNFTVDNVLLAQAPPVIATASPLADGAVGVAYSQTVTATGGTAPLTYTSTSGTLPTGLSLATTGVLSGTPTAAGIYHFTVTATDALTNSGSKDFVLYIDDADCIPLAISSLARGSFTHNSRVGPHQDSAKKIALIFRDADDTKRLNANYSTNNGVTWTEVKTSALTNIILSHDSHAVSGSNTIHVWTQEATTGRVAYFTFDLVTGTWTLENEQVSASETIINGAVSGTVLSSGDPAVVYESTSEFIVFTNYSRMTYRRRVSGSWSSALPMGDIGAAQSDLFGRLIAGNSNRATMVMTVSPGYSVASTPDFQLQIIKSDGTLSAISVFRTTGLLGTNPSYFLGDYTTYDNGTNLILVVPVKFGGDPTVFSFIDSDTPPSVSLGEPVLGNIEAEGAFVPFITRWIAGQLHTIDWGWAGSASFLRHKVADSSLGPFTPPGMADQCGPAMGDILATAQTADANVLVRTCQSVDSIYIATAVAIGTIASMTQTVKFEWIKLTDLPTSSSLTLAQWITNLSTQTISFCCAEVTPPVPLAIGGCPC